MRINEIPPQLIQQIKERIDLAEIINRHTLVDKNLKAVCPFHPEDHPSLSIHSSNKFWKCFGCGEKGDAFKFIQLIENISFSEAVKVLADETGVVMPQSKRFRGFIQRRWKTKKKKLKNLESWKWHFKQAEIERYSELRTERYKLPPKNRRDLWDYLNEQMIDYRFDLLDDKIRKIERDIKEEKRRIING